MAVAAIPAWASLGASVTLAPGAPGTIYPGSVTTLRITLSNSNTASAISQLAFTSQLSSSALPNGLEIASGTSVSYTCTGGGVSVPGSGTLTAAPGTQTVALSNGVIPPSSGGVDGSCVIDLPVTAGTNTGNSATYTYQIAGGAVTGNDGAQQANIGTVQQSVNVNALLKPIISKAFGGSGQLILGGGPVLLTVTVSNPNSVPMSGIGFTDNFPTLSNPAVGGSPVQAVIRVSGTGSSGIACTGASTPPVFTSGPTAGDTGIVVRGGTIAANSQCVITVPVEAVHTGGNYSIQQTNRISASSVTTDVGLAASADATAQVTVTSPLSVSKSGPLSLAAGQAGTFVIVLSNSGPSNLVAHFTDSPIDGLGTNGSGLLITSITGTNSQSSNLCGATVTVGNPATGFQVVGANIPGGGSCTFNVNFTGTLPSQNTPKAYTNTLAQGAVQVANPGVVSKSASATVTIYDTFHVIKAAPSPINAAPGNPVKYQVTVENWSLSAMSNVVVTDVLTENQTYLTGTINGTSYSPSLSPGCGALGTNTTIGQSTVALTIGSVPARTDSVTPGSCTVTFWAMTGTGASVNSSYNNQISANSVCYQSGGSSVCNGAGSGTVSGTISNVLQVAKTFSPTGPVNEGAVTRMTIAMTNNSVNPITSVAISDNLPLLGSGAQMRVATPANAATNCGGSPVITAVAGSTSVQLNGASVPARANSGTGTAGTCNLQVDVVAPAGSYTNQASVTGVQSYANGSAGSTVGPVTASAAITFNSALCSSSSPCTKTFNPPAVTSGGRSTVTVHLVNSGALALTNVGFADSFPAGMVLASTPNAYTTCGGSSNVAATAGANSITLAGATLGGNGSCDLVFDVVATGGASWTNTIGARAITADGGVANQIAVSGTLAYIAPTVMTLFKSTTPSSLTFPGQSSVLNITITSGSVAVSNLRLTDYFTSDGTASGAPNGMVIAAVPGATTSCSGGQMTASVGSSSVSLAGATLAASSSCSMTVNVTSTAVGGIINYLPAGSIQNDQGLSNAAQVSTSLTTQSNIGVVKQFTPNVVQPGVRARLRITFYNPTALPVTNLSVTDALPSGLTVPAGPAVFNSCSGASVTTPGNTSVQISNGSVAAASGGTAASCYVELDVLAASAGDYVNTIAASSVTGVVGGTPVTNAQPTTDTLRVKLPLVLNKAFSNLTMDSGNPASFTTGADSKAPGAPAVMTFKLTNPNATALTQASFTDNLPNHLVVAQNPGISSTCAGAVVTASADATSIRVTGATIAANSSCTVTVNVVSNISGTYTDPSPSGTVSTAEGVTNMNTTSAQLVVSTPPTVAKQFVPSVIAPGATSTLTLVLGNSNSADAVLSSTLTDTLPTAPGSIVVAGVPNVVSTCTGSVSANAGDSAVVLASGTHIPPGGCTVSVSITGATAGSYNNNIPAGALVTNFGSNQQAANAALVISTQGFLSGKVFLDNNVTPNGTFDQGIDAPLGGVGIALRSGADCSGALVSQSGLSNPTTTDALGNYLFSGLPAGTYSICEAAVSGSATGMTTAGSITLAPGGSGTAGSASAQSVSPSRVVNITLGAGNNGSVSGSDGNNFARIAPSSLAGTVYLDQNNNGLIDGFDSGISGVVVELRNGSGSSLLATTTTDSSGNYVFANLAPASYTVAEPALPSGTARGQTTAGTVAHGGTAGVATATTVTPSQIQGIVLPPNTASVANNFGLIPNGRTLSGQVFLDHNNDGLHNGADYGLPNLTLTLAGVDVNGNAVARTTTTDASGNYRFTALPESNGSGYTVTGPVAPSGTSNGVTTAGSTGTTANNASHTITGASLAGANSVSAENNFAMVPGNAPDLAISKTHSPSSFAAGSSTGYYTITPSNVGALATTGLITVSDTLPVGITLAQSPSGAGWTCDGVVGGSQFTCTSTASIAAAGTGAVIVARVAVGVSLSGQILTNTATISGGGEPPALTGNNTATDPVAIATAAAVSGHVWLDTAHNQIYGGSNGLGGWTVQLLLNGVQVASTTTATDGGYSFTGVAPGSGYLIRFLHGANGGVWGAAVPNENGQSYSSGAISSSNPAGATVSGGTLSNLTLTSGTTTTGQSLPVDPSGVVYDAVTRQPVAGAVVTITGPGSFNAATDLVGGQASQTTASDGLYQFMLNPSAPSGTYTLTVTTYPSGYSVQPSTLIPACSGSLAVAGTPAPALVQTNTSPPALSATVQPAASCPTTSGGLNPVNQSTTQYYRQFVLGGASANVVNNHIPLDPVSGSGFVLIKTGDRAQAQIGDSVRYTIDVRLNSSTVLQEVSVYDRLPPGFTFIPGTVRVNGVAAPNPQGGVGPVLGFNLGSLGGLNTVGGTAPQDLKLQYRVRIGIGAQQGNGINTAVAYGCNNSSSCLQGTNLQPVANSTQSNRGQFKVTVSGGVFSDEACVLGKIFVDCSNNHVQDDEEIGIPGVRLYFEDGGYVVSDSEGKYSRCGMTPRSHVLVVDRTTLPVGARLTTSSNRNLGDANSLFIDLKNGELHRADFIEGSCSNPVLEQVKARRAQGEIRSVETERADAPALRFFSKPASSPKEGTDSANQPLVQPRQGGDHAQ